MQPGRVSPADRLKTPTLVFVGGDKQDDNKEQHSGRENEAERMSGRESGIVGGITTWKSKGGLTYPTCVIVAEVFVSVAIFCSVCLPQPGTSTLHLHLPPE